MTNVSRRAMTAGLATVGVGVPFLVACGADGSDSASDPAGSSGAAEEPSAVGSTSAPASGTPSDDPTAASSAPAGDALAQTSDIPVEGGTIFADAQVVVTQPTKGTFKCFGSTCTHQGCQVSEVTKDGIVCPCHGSVFSLSDGSPQSGPATAPLPEKTVTVSGTSISVA